MEKKEAMKILKDFHDKSALFSVRTALDTIIPELKESKDERIRKKLLSSFKDIMADADEDELWYGLPYNDIISWLEKQGEQKPADKVEPKFRIEAGKWYICISQYCNCIEGRCYQALCDGRIIDDFRTEYDMHSDAYKYFRLWTIQDAKDGDVLYLQKDGKEHIIIYKGVIKERFRTFVSAYCAYNGIVDAFCFADVSRYVDIAYRGIMPATKEQRDILFKKMKEAGYEWDAGKKELKKIEQKSTPMSLDEAIEHCKEKSCGNNACALEHKQLEKWLIELKELKEQKSAWSKEDYKYYDKTGQYLVILLGRTTSPDEIEEIDSCIEWLKSLHPQKQWKPSEEQMDSIKYAIDYLSRDTKTVRKYLMSLYEDLKKLREE